MTHFAESCGMTIDEYADRQNRLHHWVETGIYPLRGVLTGRSPQAETCDRVRGPALTD